LHIELTKIRAKFPAKLFSIVFIYETILNNKLMAALDGGEIFYTNQNFGGNTVEKYSCIMI
jgi:hypothetical protein